MSSWSNPARSNASMASLALSASPTVPTTRFVGYAMKSRSCSLRSWSARSWFVVYITVSRHGLYDEKLRVQSKQVSSYAA